MSVAYLFPGQGSQHVGMGAELYEQVPESRAVFDQADSLLGFSLSDLCFNGPEEDLTDTANQQPALLTTSIAAWRAIQIGAWPPADYLAGHSLGEFSALVAAGSLSFADGLRLVRRRGELMAAAGTAAPGGMAAVLALDVAALHEICAAATAETGRPVQVANDNCPGQLVISGDNDALDKAIAGAEAAGARKVVRLPISIAAHSPLMAAAAADFAAAVDDTAIAPPQVPIIGNVSATALTTPAEIRAELKAQLTAAVRWTESMQTLGGLGVTTYIETGPGDVLTGLMKRIDRTSTRQVFGL